MGDDTVPIIQRLLDKASFLEGRCATWKQLARASYTQWSHFVSRPGQLLALMCLEADKEGRDVGVLASECFGWAFSAFLQKHTDAPNFMEITLKDDDGNRTIVTIQRPEGKTPAQLLSEVKAELEEAEKDEALALRNLDRTMTERDKAVAELEQIKANLGLDRDRLLFEPNPRT